MRPSVVGRWIGRAGLTCGLAITFAGCPDSPEDITQSASPPAFNFPVAVAYEEPVGSFAVDRLTLAAFDSTVTDAFGRQVPGLGLFATDPFFEFPGWNLWSTGRNSTQDPRLPALGGTGTEAVDRFCGLWGPGFGGGTGVWDLFCEMAGMAPSTRYTMMLARYATRINGALDAAEMLLTGTVTDPDELVLLDGTPQGYPTTPCDFSTFVSPIVDANPLVLGFQDSNASGQITSPDFIDCLIDSGGIWWASTAGPPPPGAADSAAFAPNIQQTFSLPEYNYAVLVEGQGDATNPVPAGPAVFRWQVGPDILESGAPINNGLAPFPVGAASVPDLVNAPGGAGRPDSVSVTFNRLEALAGTARYEVWLVNPLTGSIVPAVGTYYEIEIVAERDPITGEIISTTDVLVDSVFGTASFVGGNAGDGFRHRLVISDATVAPETVGVHSHVMLTVDATPGDLTPSAARPFWMTITDQAGTPADFFDDAISSSGATDFGTFDATSPAASYTYTAQGFGLGGVRDDAISIDLENLSRPPVGYMYAAWLVPETGTPVRLEDITGPAPERVSLVDADSELIPGLVTPTGILEANFRGVESSLGIDFSGYPSLVVTLETKIGDPGISPLTTIAGALPPAVLAGARVSN